MRKFLEQILTAEQLKAVEDAYKAKYPNSEGLPEYISKGRLDEEINKRKTAETNLSNVQKELEVFPKDFKEQLKAKDDEITSMKDAHKKELERVQKDALIDTEILKAKGRNVKAIKALIDPEKDIAEELKRLQESDAYLFGTNRKKGTGKDDDGSNDDDGNGGLSEADMKRAVGIL